MLKTVFPHLFEVRSSNKRSIIETANLKAAESSIYFHKSTHSILQTASLGRIKKTDRVK